MDRRSRLRSTVLTLLLVSLFSRAFSITFTVCPSACAYATLSDLVNAGVLADYDSIAVSSGSYSENQVVLTTVTTIDFEAGTQETCSSCTSGEWLTLQANLTMGGEVTLAQGGIQVGSGVTFAQNGTITITSAYTTGVTILAGSTWVQQAPITISLENQGVATGVQLKSGSTWIQDAAASLNVVGSSSVFFNAGGTWQQNADAVITTSSSTAGVQFVGGGVWNQTGTVTVNSTNNHGVQIKNSGTWNQLGSATVYVSNGNSAAVSLASSGCQWTQVGEAQLVVLANATGVLFGSGGSWQQSSATTVNVTSSTVASVGIDLSAGGTWNQGNTVNMNVDGSAASGIKCATTAAGWTSTTAVTYTVGGGGSQGDCSPAGSASTSPTPSVSLTPFPSPSVTATPSLSPSSTPTSSVSATPSSTNTANPSPSSVPSTTPSPSASAMPSPPPSESAISTPSPSPSPSATPTPSPTPSPSAIPTASPTTSPTTSPSVTPTASTSFVPSPSSSPIYLVSNTTTVVAVPVLQFNLTGPDIVLLPKDNQGTVQTKAAVGVSLAQLQEVDPLSGSTVRSGSAVNGSWKQVVDTELGASSSYLFTADLDTYDAQGDVVDNNGSSVELQFYLFDSQTNISLGDLAFDVLPSFAKFSIRLFSWPWSSPSDLIEMRMKLSPSFTNFTRSANTPKAGMTTFLLGGQPASQNTVTELRLVNSIELDGQLVNSGGVSFDLDTNSSDLVLRFAYFNSSVVYDPGTGGGSSGSGSLPLIVAVSVAVPVAIVFVIASAVVVVIIAHRQRKARMRRLTKTMQSYQL